MQTILEHSKIKCSFIVYIPPQLISMSPIRKFLNSFYYAFQGLITAYQIEFKIKLHSLATIVVIAFAISFNFNYHEWIVSLLCIGLVLITELINTAFEQLANFAAPDFNEKIKRTKDIAASAVFVAATLSLTIWFIIIYYHFNSNINL